MPEGPTAPPAATTSLTERRHRRVAWLDDEQQATWRAFVLGTQLLLGRLDEELSHDHRLSLPEYEILVRLNERGGRMRMAQLADAMAHSRSRVTHTVKRLERDGLVQREAAADDGRGVDAVLSPLGLAALDFSAPDHVRGVREHLVDLVDPQDLAAVGRVMNAVCDHLIGTNPDVDIRPR